MLSLGCIPYLISGLLHIVSGFRSVIRQIKTKSVRGWEQYCTNCWIDWENCWFRGWSFENHPEWQQCKVNKHDKVLLTVKYQTIFQDVNFLSITAIVISQPLRKRPAGNIGAKDGETERDHYTIN